GEEVVMGVATTFGRRLALGTFWMLLASVGLALASPSEDSYISGYASAVREPQGRHHVGAGRPPAVRVPFPPGHALPAAPRGPEVAALLRRVPLLHRR